MSTGIPSIRNLQYPVCKNCVYFIEPVPDNAYYGKCTKFGQGHYVAQQLSLKVAAGYRRTLVKWTWLQVALSMTSRNFVEKMKKNVVGGVMGIKRRWKQHKVVPNSSGDFVTFWVSCWSGPRSGPTTKFEGCKAPGELWMVEYLFINCYFFRNILYNLITCFVFGIGNHWKRLYILFNDKKCLNTFRLNI